MPTKWQFARKGGHYQLKQVSLNNGWHEFVGEVALSFARLLVHTPRVSSSVKILTVAGSITMRAQIRVGAGVMIHAPI
jgi:hypothetical protein